MRENTLCPACNCHMSAITERDVEIDCCYLCHGIWLDAGELSALFDAHATEPSQESMADFAGTFFFDSISRDDLFCPCCMEELVDTPFGEGHISVCVTCGGMFIESATLDLILPDPANILFQDPQRKLTSTGSQRSPVLCSCRNAEPFMMLSPDGCCDRRRNDISMQGRGQMQITREAGTPNA